MRTAIALTLAAAAFLAPAESLDWQAQRAVQSARRPGLEGTMRMATGIGKPVLVCGALVVVALVDRAAGLETLRTAALALVPTNLVVEGLKRATDRARPDGEHRRSNASFPSSHAANAFALAWVLARRWPRSAAGLFAFAALVAFSRIYLNRHFTSDVLVGLAIGLLFGWLATRWARRHPFRRGRSMAGGGEVPPAEAPPGR